MLWGQHLISNPSIGLLCWLQKSGPEDLVLLLESKGSSRTKAGVYTQSLGIRLIISLGKYATVFQAEIYTISACAHEIQANARSEKYVSICSESQAALKALQAIKTSPHWHNSAKRHWMTFPPSTLWDSFGSLDILGYEEMELPTSLQKTE